MTKDSRCFIPVVGMSAILMASCGTTVSAEPDSQPRIQTTDMRLGMPPAERGMSLGLFSAEDTYRYHQLVDEIVALGVTHVQIVWVWWQDRAKSTVIRRRPGMSATDAQIVETIRYARDRGLHVTAFPIVRIEKGGAEEWRGVIAPGDENAWWDSYQAYIETSADFAAKGGAQRLSIGSELLSREGMRPRWKTLTTAIRSKHPGLELLYSANWDHFTQVSFWDLVDVAGVTGYWELTPTTEASTDELERKWADIKPWIEVFGSRAGRPLVITEIGYPSLDGAAIWPWNETRTAALDQVEQYRAYLAFARAWSDTPWIRGIYWWNWFGFGGPKDKKYTPRKKPAADVVRQWYQKAQ